MPDPLAGLDFADFSRSLGVIGFLFYAGSYAMLSARAISGDSMLYFGLNTIAAVCVTVSLVHDFNLASLMIQSFWIVTGLGAMTIRLQARMRERRIAHIPVPLHHPAPQSPAAGLQPHEVPASA
ncbi:CBU_0592 family membrane protein [Salipiger mucosus]|nr:hypothetical protein [Salipiger mucosus]